MIDPAIFFPPEVVARIAEFVAEEPAADRLPILLALSSSSRSWHYAVQRPLYRSIRLGTIQCALRFLISISANSTHAGCVEAVSLAPSATSFTEAIAFYCKNIKAVEYRDEGSIDLFPYMQPVPGFPFLSLTTLSFACVSSHYMLNFGTFPLITHLSLRELKRLPPRNLAVIFPDLTSLRISITRLNGESTCDVLARLSSLPHLRHLSLQHLPDISDPLGLLQDHILDRIPHLDILEIPPIDELQARDTPPSPFFDSAIGILRLHSPQRRDGRPEEPLLGLLEKADQVRRMRRVAKVSLPLGLADLRTGEACVKILARWEKEGVGVVFEEWARWEFGEEEEELREELDD